MRWHSVRRGLVLAADSRTNAGVDQIATVRKLALFERPGERVMPWRIWRTRDTLISR